MEVFESTKEPRPETLNLRAWFDPDQSLTAHTTPDPPMKIVHAQHRPPPSRIAGFGPWLFKLPVTALVVSCTFFAVGCADRRPTPKDSATLPPPATTAPVLTPPTAPDRAPAVTQSVEPAEQTTPTGRVAEDTSPARESGAVPSLRADDEGDSTPPDSVKADGVTAVSPGDTAPTPLSSSSADEEDVSAALRREVAEIERRRAQQQPRRW